jgi:recombination protein RecA
MASIADVRKRIEKKYSGDIELFPDFTVIRAIPVIKSPSAIINATTGIGGLPRGRVTEIVGPFGTGKTTILTECVAQGQQSDPGFVALFVDYEHAWDPIYARKLGTNLSPDRLIYCQPQYFEQGADIAMACVDEGLVDLIVIDSAAAMTPKSEMEGDMDTDGGSQKGTQAALMARFLERITKKISQGRKPALAIANQTRAFIQIGGRPQKNAPKEVPAGGNALKFYTSLRLQLEIVTSEGDENRGTKGTDQLYTQNRVRVTCIKNKLAPPFMRGQFVIEYGSGINNLLSIAELAEAKLGIMHGAGFYNYTGRTPETSIVCRGREVFQARLKESPDTLAEIEELTLLAIKQETAAALGIDEIKTQGSAKEIEARTTILRDEEEQTPTHRDHHEELGAGESLPIEE